MGLTLLSNFTSVIYFVDPSGLSINSPSMGFTAILRHTSRTNSSRIALWIAPLGEGPREPNPTQTQHGSDKKLKEDKEPTGSDLHSLPCAGFDFLMDSCSLTSCSHAERRQ